MGLFDSLRAWIDGGTRRGAAAAAQPPAPAAPDLAPDDWQAELLLRIEQRVVHGHFPIVRLPAAHLQLTGLAGAPAVDTVAVSLRSLLFESRVLAEYAGEVWRQSYSRACIARAIGPACGIDPERAFDIGLLQDVGKLPLLRLLRDELPDDKPTDPALIERVLDDWHELAGARVADEWRLSTDLASVIAAHHDFRACADEPRLAAFARLVHRLDSLLALPGERESGALLRGLEMDALGLQEVQRLALVRAAREAFEAAQRDPLMLGADSAPSGRTRGADSIDVERAVA